MERTKNFSMSEDGKTLIVKVTDENDVVIYVEGQRENIGTFQQVTVQNIPKDNVQKLLDFVEGEKAQTEKKVDNLKAQLEPLKEIVEIDEVVIKHCRQAIDKGSKKFKKSMQVLNKRIFDIDQKKPLMFQLEYAEKQLNEINSDLEELKKTL